MRKKAEPLTVVCYSPLSFKGYSSLRRTVKGGDEEYVIGLPCGVPVALNELERQALERHIDTAEAVESCIIGPEHADELRAKFADEARDVEHINLHNRVERLRQRLLDAGVSEAEIDDICETTNEVLVS